MELVYGIKTEKTQVKEASQKTGEPLTKEAKKERAKEEFGGVVERSGEWVKQHISVVNLICLLLFSCPLWLLFRHSPAIADMRLSECFVAMVYITDMIIIYHIIPSLLCFSVKAEIVFDLLAILLVIIPIKQLSGYSYWSTFWRLLAALIPFVIVWILMISLVTVTMYLISK